MSKSWAGEWCYFKSYVDAQTCNRIIKDAQNLPIQDALVGNNAGAGLDAQNRRSKIRFINSSDWRFTYLYDILWKTAISANNDFFNIQISKLDFVQLAEYDSSYQGEYKEHHDVFWLNDDDFYHRKLTAVLQLSDPNSYVGGDLELTESVHKPLYDDVRQQGTITFFPSMMRHRATPVTKGTRYSIAAWFDGPKWR